MAERESPNDIGIEKITPFVSKVAKRTVEIVDTEERSNYLQRKLDKLKNESALGSEQFPNTKSYCRLEREKIELENERKRLAEEGTISTDSLSSKYKLKRKFQETGSKIKKLNFS